MVPRTRSSNHFTATTEQVLLSWRSPARARAPKLKMHPREISKVAAEKMRQQQRLIFCGLGKAGGESGSGRGLGGKAGKWVMRLSAFLARQRCRSAAGAAARRFPPTWQEKRQNQQKEKPVGKIVPLALFRREPASPLACLPASLWNMLMINLRHVQIIVTALGPTCWTPRSLKLQALQLFRGRKMRKCTRGTAGRGPRTRLSAN